MNCKPVFCICGAGGVGISSVAADLIARKSALYVVLNGILTDAPCFPENLREVRRYWNDVCFDIVSQTERSVVYYIYGYADMHRKVPKERLEKMHFITLICEESVLRKRAYEEYGERANKVLPYKVDGKEITQTEMMLLRNRYFKIYHDEHEFQNMILIDTTDMTVSEIADRIEAYIKEQICLSDIKNEIV